MSLNSLAIVGTGMGELAKALDKSPEILREVNEGARRVQRTAKVLIRSKNKTGRQYRRKFGKEGRTQRYTASAPGEAPARFTGSLAKGVKVRRAKVSHRTKTAYVRSTSPHSHLMAFGTESMAPRPFMNVALRAVRRDVAEAIKRAYGRSASKAVAKNKQRKGRIIRGKR